MNSQTKTLELGGMKLTATLDGPLLRVKVEDAKGDTVEWLNEEVNEGRGIAYTTDKDLLALDGAFESAERWAAYERAERDPEFRQIAGLSDHDMKHWRKWRAEDEAKKAAA